MSRREDRDSDSRRRRSRFDREPSPKRSRRDEKPKIERSEAFGYTNQNEKQHQRSQDALPLEAASAPDPKVGSGSAGRETEKKADGNHTRTKHSFHPSEAPHSRSYNQHEGRDSSRQVGRRSSSERGRRDGYDRQDDAPANKSTTNESHRRDEKTRAKESENWHRKRLDEAEGDLLPARKRRTFTEKKIIDSEKKIEDEQAPTSSRSDRPIVGSGKEERSRSPHHLDRSNKLVPKDGAFNNVRRGPYQSRERYGAGRGGRDRFSRRPEHPPSNIRVEKWKHDLFEQANRSPSPKNEEEQIAKVEALLASS